LLVRGFIDSLPAGNSTSPHFIFVIKPQFDIRKYLSN
jgi:hypothetical protein